MSQKQDKIGKKEDGRHESAPQFKGLDAVIQELKGQSYPPVHLWNPEFCGDIDMRIARDGQWYYMGTPFTRPEMVRLFSTVLRYDVGESEAEIDYTSGKYYLVTPVEKLGIIVDDAPFVAIQMDVEGKGENQVISFRTQTDDLVIVGPENPVWVEFDKKTDEPSPYVLVRDNLRALINRPLFYELVNLAEETKTADGTLELMVRSNGQLFKLGEIENV